MATRVGSRVRLDSVAGDIFEGFIHSVDQNVGKLTLQKVTLCGVDNKRKLQGLQHFHAEEIKEIEVFEDFDSTVLASNTDVSTRRESGPRLWRVKETPRHLQKRAPLKIGALVTHATQDAEDTGRVCRNNTTGSLKSSDYDSSSDVGEGSGYGQFNVIDKLDEVFREAVDHIRGQSLISVGLEGVFIGRDGELCWLQVSTKDQIFLFDVLTLDIECFHQGLQDILESGQILKVMHDCRQPSDLLYHQFGVELVNVFDTQVAAVFIYRMCHHGDYPRYVDSQHSLLVEYMDIDLNDIHILRYREKHKKEDQEIWRQRPAPLNILTAASKQVKHLLNLRIKLMEQLLKEVNVGTNIYLGYVRDASKEDSKRGLTSRHLLPHAFQHLNTHMDFVRHHYHRPARMYSAGPLKDERGFDENCNGVMDPYVVASPDSIWHQGTNWKSPAYRRKTEGDQFLRYSPAVRKDSKSLPNSPHESTLDKSSPTKRGYRVARGPSEVRRPTVNTSAAGDAEISLGSARSLKTVSEASEMESEPKTKTVEEQILFRPAGFFQDDLGKKKRNNYISEDSDMENQIQIGDYISHGETDFDDSFSCIPSRESLGRPNPSEHRGSLRKSMEAIRKAEDKTSATVENTDEQLAFEDPAPRKTHYEQGMLSDEETEYQNLPQNKYLTSRLHSGSESDTGLTRLSNLKINSSPGIGRGICQFASPPSPQSSHSSETIQGRPSTSSHFSPQELLNSFHSSEMWPNPSTSTPEVPNSFHTSEMMFKPSKFTAEPVNSFHTPEMRSKPSTSTPDSAEKSILQTMVNSNSAESSPYGRQMSRLKALTSAKQTSNSSGNSYSSDDTEGSSKSRTNSPKDGKPAVTFDSLLRQLSRKQY